MKRVRMALVFSVAAVALFLTRNAIAQAMLGLVAPHRVHAPIGVMSDAFAARLDAEPKSRNDVGAKSFVLFALEETGKQFHFGLDHKTRLAYDGVEREGNCVEYADLFARIVNRERSDLHAYVVRSDARLLGERLGRPAFNDHDWVLVTSGQDRFYVDPTLYDMGLGWNVASSVKGEPKLP